MGYAPTVPYTTLEFNVRLEAAISVSSVASDIDINDITLPTWKNPLTYAYLDIYALVFDNTAHAGINYIAAGSWGVEDTGGTYHAAGNIAAMCWRVLASTYQFGHFILPGYINISPYITSGATQTVRFDDIRTIANCGFRDVFGRIRMYFMG